MTVTTTVEPCLAPLSQDESGRWRVAGSRVPLERVVECYKQGMSPEAIVEDFDTVRLADVYKIIGYYLDHKEAVEAYIHFWEARAAELEAMIKATQPLRPGLKEELQA